MTYKAMKLDPLGVLLGVVTLEDDAELPPNHVDLRPHGGDCDRPPLEYRWDGQTLVPLPKTQRPSFDGTSMEAAYYADLKLRAIAGAELPAATRAWLEWYEKTVDAIIRGKG